MTSKKWFFTFAATVAVLAAAVMGFNLIADPFGVFKGSFMEWPSYEMTLNPRTAKTTYIEKHHDEYDSYIIGCSSTSSYTTDELNRYFGADFYNMIMYGADMLDVENMSKWLADNYEVKNLVVNVYIDNTLEYDSESNPLTFSMSPDAMGGSKLDKARFDWRFLTADPRHALDKVKAMMKDTYLTQSFDVFNEKTGAYDKKVRDVEGIGDMDEYLDAYPVFKDYPTGEHKMSERAVQGTLDSISRIKEMCEERGINFMVVQAPVYHEYYSQFDMEEIADFTRRLADVTPFWDFSYSSVSFEPRYFYDATHFRNCVGRMALARIFDDDSIYIPDDFGMYVTPENVEECINKLRSAGAADTADYTTDLPIITYHHIKEGASQSTEVTPEAFERQMTALKNAGYNTVTLEQVEAYVRKGEPLPEKPVMITFDDGYRSNYEYAYPILKKYNMHAVIFAVGSTIGSTKYKDTDYDITPHFTAEEGREMIESGVMEIQSHTYDLHQWADYEESGTARDTVLRIDGESESDYMTMMNEDCARERDIIESEMGGKLHAISYPHGDYDDLAAVMMSENGFDISFTVNKGINVLIKGIDQSMLALKRNNADTQTTDEQLLTSVSR